MLDALVQYKYVATIKIANQVFNRHGALIIQRNPLLTHVLLKLRQRNCREAGCAVVGGPAQGGTVGCEVNLHRAFQYDQRRAVAGPVGDVLGDGGVLGHGGS